MEFQKAMQTTLGAIGKLSARPKLALSTAMSVALAPAAVYSADAVLNSVSATVSASVSTMPVQKTEPVQIEADGGGATPENPGDDITSTNNTTDSQLLAILDGVLFDYVATTVDTTTETVSGNTIEALATGNLASGATTTITTVDATNQRDEVSLDLAAVTDGGTSGTGTTATNLGALAGLVQSYAGAEDDRTGTVTEPASDYAGGFSDAVWVTYSTETRYISGTDANYDPNAGDFLLVRDASTTISAGVTTYATRYYRDLDEDGVLDASEETSGNLISSYANTTGFIDLNQDTVVTSANIIGTSDTFDFSGTGTASATIVDRADFTGATVTGALSSTELDNWNSGDPSTSTVTLDLGGLDEAEITARVDDARVEIDVDELLGTGTLVAANNSFTAVATANDGVVGAAGTIDGGFSGASVDGTIADLDVSADAKVSPSQVTQNLDGEFVSAAQQSIDLVEPYAGPTGTSTGSATFADLAVVESGLVQVDIASGDTSTGTATAGLIEGAVRVEDNNMVASFVGNELDNTISVLGGDNPALNASVVVSTVQDADDILLSANEYSARTLNNTIEALIGSTSATTAVTTFTGQATIRDNRVASVSVVNRADNTLALDQIALDGISADSLGDVTLTDADATSTATATTKVSADLALRNRQTISDDVSQSALNDNTTIRGVIDGDTFASRVSLDGGSLIVNENTVSAAVLGNDADNVISVTESASASGTAGLLNEQIATIAEGDSTVEFDAEVSGTVIAAINNNGIDNRGTLAADENFVSASVSANTARNSITYDADSVADNDNITGTSAVGTVELAGTISANRQGGTIDAGIASLNSQTLLNDSDTDLAARLQNIDITAASDPSAGGGMVSFFNSRDAVISADGNVGQALVSGNVTVDTVSLGVAADPVAGTAADPITTLDASVSIASVQNAEPSSGTAGNDLTALVDDYDVLASIEDGTTTSGFGATDLTGMTLSADGNKLLSRAEGNDASLATSVVASEQVLTATNENGSEALIQLPGALADIDTQSAQLESELSVLNLQTLGLNVNAELRDSSVTVQALTNDWLRDSQLSANSNVADATARGNAAGIDVTYDVGAVQFGDAAYTANPSTTVTTTTTTTATTSINYINYDGVSGYQDGGSDVRVVESSTGVYVYDNNENGVFDAGDGSTVSSSIVLTGTVTTTSTSTTATVIPATVTTGEGFGALSQVANVQRVEVSAASIASTVVNRDVIVDTFYTGTSASDPQVDLKVNNNITRATAEGNTASIDADYDIAEIRNIVDPTKSVTIDPDNTAVGVDVNDYTIGVANSQSVVDTTISAEIDTTGTSVSRIGVDAGRIDGGAEINNNLVMADAVANNARGDTATSPSLDLSITGEYDLNAALVSSQYASGSVTAAIGDDTSSTGPGVVISYESERDIEGFVSVDGNQIMAQARSNVATANFDVNATTTGETVDNDNAALVQMVQQSVSNVSASVEGSQIFVAGNDMSDGAVSSTGVSVDDNAVLASAVGNDGVGTLDFSTSVLDFGSGNSRVLLDQVLQGTVTAAVDGTVDSRGPAGNTTDFNIGAEIDFDVVDGGLTVDRNTVNADAYGNIGRASLELYSGDGIQSTDQFDGTVNSTVSAGVNARITDYRIGADVGDDIGESDSDSLGSVSVADNELRARAVGALSTVTVDVSTDGELDFGSPTLQATANQTIAADMSATLADVDVRVQADTIEYGGTATLANNTATALVMGGQADVTYTATGAVTDQDSDNEIDADVDQIFGTDVDLLAVVNNLDMQVRVFEDIDRGNVDVAENTALATATGLRGVSSIDYELSGTYRQDDDASFDAHIYQFGDSSGAHSVTARAEDVAIHADISDDIQGATVDVAGNRIDAQATGGYAQATIDYMLDGDNLRDDDWSDLTLHAHIVQNLSFNETLTVTAENTNNRIGLEADSLEAASEVAAGTFRVSDNALSASAVGLDAVASTTYSVGGQINGNPDGLDDVNINADITQEDPVDVSATVTSGRIYIDESGVDDVTLGTLEVASNSISAQAVGQSGEASLDFNVDGAFTSEVDDSSDVTADIYQDGIGTVTATNTGAEIVVEAGNLASMDNTAIAQDNIVSSRAVGQEATADLLFRVGGVWSQLDDELEYSAETDQYAYTTSVTVSAIVSDARIAVDETSGTGIGGGTLRADGNTLSAAAIGQDARTTFALDLDGAVDNLDDGSNDFEADMYQRNYASVSARVDGGDTEFVVEADSVSASTSVLSASENTLQARAEGLVADQSFSIDAESSYEIDAGFIGADYNGDQNGAVVARIEGDKTGTAIDPIVIGVELNDLPTASGDVQSGTIAVDDNRAEAIGFGANLTQNVQVDIAGSIRNESDVIQAESSTQVWGGVDARLRYLDVAANIGNVTDNVDSAAATVSVDDNTLLASATGAAQTVTYSANVDGAVQVGYDFEIDTLVQELRDNPVIASIGDRGTGGDVNIRFFADDETSEATDNLTGTVSGNLASAQATGVSSAFDFDLTVAGAVDGLNGASIKMIDMNQFTDAPVYAYASEAFIGMDREGVITSSTLEVDSNTIEAVALGTSVSATRNVTVGDTEQAGAFGAEALYSQVVTDDVDAFVGTEGTNDIQLLLGDVGGDPVSTVSLEGNTIRSQTTGALVNLDTVVTVEGDVLTGSSTIADVVEQDVLSATTLQAVTQDANIEALAGSLTGGSISVSDNRATSLATGASQTTSLALNVGGVHSGDLDQVSSDQSVTSNVSALTDGIDVMAEADSVSAASLLADNNTVRADARGALSSSTLSVDVGGDLAGDANADQSVTSLQSVTGTVDADVSDVAILSRAVNGGTEGAVQNGGVLSADGNSVLVTAIGARAENLAVTLDVGGTAAGRTPGDVTVSSGLSTSTAEESHVASIQNDQFGNGLVTADGSSIEIGLEAAAVDTSTASLEDNTIWSEARGNIAINALSFTAGTDAQAPAILSNSQTRRAATQASLTGANITGLTTSSPSALNGTVRVDGNTLRASAASNVAASTLDVTSGGQISGAGGVGSTLNIGGTGGAGTSSDMTLAGAGADFAMLNSQTDTHGAQSIIANSAITGGVGGALNNGSLASVSSNVIRADATSNSVEQSIVLASSYSGTDAGTALGNYQRASGTVRAEVVNTSIGITAAGMTGATGQVVNNRITARAVGNVSTVSVVKR